MSTPSVPPVPEGFQAPPLPRPGPAPAPEQSGEVLGLEALLHDDSFLAPDPEVVARRTQPVERVRPGPGFAEAVYSAALALGASDLHVGTGLVPACRAAGALVELEGFDPLTPRDVLGIAASVDPAAPDALKEGDVDFGGTIPGAPQWRARGNLHMSRGNPSLVVRFLTGTVPHIAELGVPSMVAGLGDLESGLVLLAGETGSGKSTTHAALIDQINSKYTKTILTLEDPVEYLHQSKRSRVTQRELHSDFPTFERGLQSALRSDPDVILLGEIRSADSAEVAMNAAASGHLVLSTVHGANAGSALARFVDLFPAGAKDHVLSLLAGSIQAVVCQVLLRRQDQMATRQVVCECLRVDTAARGTIRAGRFEDLANNIQSSQVSTSFEEQFALHVAAGRLSIDQAMGNVSSQELFRRYLQNQPRKQPGQ